MNSKNSVKKKIQNKKQTNKQEEEHTFGSHINKRNYQGSQIL
jgi:hypothetical protein